MSKPSLREKYIAALQAEGSKIIPGRSTRYIQMTYGENTGIFYFVGRSGSLRKGRNVVSSRPVSDEYKRMLRDRVT